MANPGTNAVAKVVMYTRVPCPYCGNAKRFLQQKGVAFEEIDLSNKPDELQELQQRTGWRTVPQIFIGDKMIGGFTDMIALEDSGELDLLLGLKK
jgi:glutaredoxin 3